MSDPLLRNLRDPGPGTDATLLRVCWQAADEIERLRAALRRARAEGRGTLAISPEPDLVARLRAWRDYEFVAGEVPHDLITWAIDEIEQGRIAAAMSESNRTREQLSPWIEIEFPSLDTGDVIQAQLAQLDKAEQRAREELQQRLNVINDTRKRILALSFKPAEVVEAK